MLKSSLMPLAAICTTLLAGTGSAQTGNPTIDNSGRLQTAISLDRATYFPGEAAVLTLIARNPQRTPLEAPEPFAGASACFDLSRLASGGAFVPLSSRPVCPFRTIESDSAKALFGPGEERRAAVTGDALWPGADSAASSLSIGYYQVASHTSTASAVFRIVAPHLETATAVRLRDIAYDDPATGRALRLTAYLHVFSVRWFNQSFLCVAQSPSLRDTAIVTDSGGNVVGVNVPYRRLAAVANPIASIKATANLQDNLAITWTDSTGLSQTVLAASASHPPTGALEVGLDSTYGRVVPGASLEFHARVAGSGNGAVRWSVMLAPGAPAGAPTGSVTASGRYVAPAEVEMQYAVIVMAQSQADPSRSAFGVVSLQPRTEITLALPTPAVPADAKRPAPVAEAAVTADAVVPRTGPLP
jgi:hypothetical protein